MPTRDSAPAGAPCWIDLSTSDVDRSRSFYAELFGWTAEAPSEEFGGYFMFARDGMPIAGGMPAMPDQPVTDAWSIYLAVDDARKTTELAESNGATVVVPPMDVADLGTMAVFLDPSEVAIGIWQAGTFPGFITLSEPGAPSWFEVYSRDYERCCDFYRDVFGVEVVPMGDEFRYSTFHVNGEPVAGIMDANGQLPDEVPPHWTAYIGVADADAAVAKVQQLGGSVTQPAEDTPYGRIAGVVDANGAPFRLVAANEEMPAK